MVMMRLDPEDCCHEGTPLSLYIVKVMVLEYHTMNGKATVVTSFFAILHYSRMMFPLAAFHKRFMIATPRSESSNASM